MKKSKVVKKVSVLPERQPVFHDLSPQAKQAIGAVIMAVVGVFFAAALTDFGGLIGGWTQIALYWLFGTGAYLAPLVCGFYVYALLNPRDNEGVSMSKVTGIALLFISMLGFLELYTATYGGMVGLALLWPTALITWMRRAGMT